MITPKQYKMAIKVLKQELIITKNWRKKYTKKQDLKKIDIKIENLQGVLELLEGRE